MSIVYNSKELREEKISLADELQELRRLLKRQEEEITFLKKENEILTYEVERQVKETRYYKESFEQQEVMFKQTSEYMTDIIAQAEGQKKEIQTKNTALEQAVKDLQESHDEIEMQRNYLEETMQKLQESYDEIEMQKNYLESAIKEIQEDKFEIDHQKKIIEEAFKELDKVHSDTAASIQYAKRIQQAMLPPKEMLANYFEESFILLKPKDVVSGDFYWFIEEDNKFIIAAVDCTGHGVPGAFMSMIGDALLNQIVKIHGITSPDLILNELHMSVRQMLKQQDGENRDGMDVAMCVFDLQTNEMTFAGARNSVYLLENGNLTEIKGDKYSIGGYQHETYRIFTKHTIKIEQETAIYLTSDGYKDQFGEKEGKKFSANRFRELLKSIHHLPAKTQYTTIKQTFENWKGTEKQIDDVLVIGFKFCPQSF